MPSQSVIVDLSHPLSSTVQVYPGDPTFSSSQVANVPKHGYSVHSFALGTHTGTHIDAPSHFLENGLTIDQIPLSQLTGACVVLDFTHKGAREKITQEDLIPYASQLDNPTQVHIVLIRTGWSKFWGTERYYDHPYLTKDAADYFVRCTDIELIGLDAFSPDETRADGGHTEHGFGFHEVFLGAGNLIVENLTSLEEVTSGDLVYFMPLKLEGFDGSPIRAIAHKLQTR